MKVKMLCLLLIVLISKSWAQIEYEKGYFIDNNQVRVECLIKNSDWKNNPTSFEYRLDASDQPKLASIDGVKEFAIEGSSKYVRADIMIDRSSDKLFEMDYDKEPDWHPERQFLKFLVEGSASLLRFADGNLERFFYQVNDTTRQLIYKKYLPESGEALENNAFRQQLWIDVRCGNTPTQVYKGIDYNKRDLMRYFKDYARCRGEEQTDYTQKKDKNIFHMKVTPGMSYSSMSLRDSYNRNKTLNMDFKNTLNFRIGIEGEFILPFNRNKWSIVVEPNYQAYSSTATLKGNSYTTTNNAIEIPVGVRYYSFLTNESRIFANAFVNTNLPRNDASVAGFEITTTVNFMGGAGFEFKKLSAEIRYYWNGDVLNEVLYFDGKYARLSFILGYRLF